ncbi:hypothetical protein FAM09_24630 [Niastella caeni]|uniref:HNH endonuclease n=1 Tax=Niastella caeni TaxID=2569763 RepID=A0A4S8HGC3_9BACT|nr:hypothetical protein [Niastella caeni]THU34208.1 hypothetical protein FAM09_24630 [Niastella caeni]
MRDEFSNKVKEILARRVAYRCSNPGCLKVTSGPHPQHGSAINIGVAAHIEAASTGGKRFNSQQSNEQRSCIENGIWLCQNCAKLIDSDDLTYTVNVLKGWKTHTETLILELVTNHGQDPRFSINELIERRVAESKAFHKPNLALHGRPIYSRELILARFRNTGYKAVKIFVVASIYDFSLDNLIIDKQSVLDTDEVVTITLVAKISLLNIVRCMINLSYEDVDGRRYQQHFTFSPEYAEITPPEMLGNI